MVHKSLDVKTGHLRPGSASDGGALLAPHTHNALLRAVGDKQDKESFSQLFQYFAPRIKSYLMKGGASPEQADELAQETMISVWSKASGFDPAQASASTWIFTIARNKRVDALRRTAARHELDLPELPMIEDSAPGPETQLSQNEDTNVIAEALEKLPAEQADLIRRSFFEGKSHGDIASETGIALGTVKSRIRAALERLRGDLKAEDVR